VVEAIITLGMLINPHVKAKQKKYTKAEVNHLYAHTGVEPTNAARLILGRQIGKVS
jgi:hypothetical protein